MLGRSSISQNHHTHTHTHTHRHKKREKAENSYPQTEGPVEVRSEGMALGKLSFESGQVPWWRKRRGRSAKKKNAREGDGKKSKESEKMNAAEQVGENKGERS